MSGGETGMNDAAPGVIIIGMTSAQVSAACAVLILQASTSPGSPQLSLGSAGPGSHCSTALLRIPSPHFGVAQLSGAWSAAAALAAAPSTMTKSVPAASSCFETSPSVWRLTQLSAPGSRVSQVFRIADSCVNLQTDGEVSKQELAAGTYFET